MAPAGGVKGSRGRRRISRFSKVAWTRWGERARKGGRSILSEPQRISHGTRAGLQPQGSGRIHHLTFTAKAP
jgi:hypothetical protein